MHFLVKGFILLSVVRSTLSAPTNATNEQEKAAEIAAEFEKVMEKSIKQDTFMMRRPFMAMEEQLMHAPLALTVLGKLALIGTQRDFPLNSGDMDVDYKKLKYPGSFRASLTQLNQEVYWAFHEGHLSMFEIVVQTNQTKRYLNQALKTLLQGKPEDVEKYFPIQMEKVQAIADVCRERSRETADKFKEVMEVILEFQLSAINEQGMLKNETYWAKTLLGGLNSTLTSLEKEHEERVKQYKKHDDAIKKATKRFDDAFDANQPSLGILVGYGLSEAFVSTVNSLGKAVSTLLSGPQYLVQSFGNGFSTGFTGVPPSNSNNNNNDNNNDNSNNIDDRYLLDDYTNIMEPFLQNTELTMPTFFYRNKTINPRTTSGSASELGSPIIELKAKINTVKDRIGRLHSEDSDFVRFISATERRLSKMQRLCQQIYDKSLTDDSNDNVGLYNKMYEVLNGLFDAMPGKNNPSINGALAKEIIELATVDIYSMRKFFSDNEITEVEDLIEPLKEKKSSIVSFRQSGASRRLSHKAIDIIDELLELFTNQGLTDPQEKFEDLSNKLTTLKDVDVHIVLQTPPVEKITKALRKNFSKGSNSFAAQPGCSSYCQAQKQAYQQMEVARQQMEISQRLADNAFDR